MKKTMTSLVGRTSIFVDARPLSHAATGLAQVAVSEPGHHSSLRTLAFATVSLSLLAAPVAAQPAIEQSRPATVSATSPRLAGLSDFIDGVLAQQIATREVAGAVVTVVHDGKVLLTRGYGFADIEKGRKVEPEQTLFRPGSVSKLFTWVALMQQVEAGRVDLDADVNTYLDFTIPAHASGPVRVRHLLSHTPGLSDVGGLSVDAPGKITPYAEWLKRAAAAPLWAPGTETAYSNYGAVLAGYIVERVSGQPFADYVEKNLFAPLGMRATTFREPLPGPMSRHIATGYRTTEGTLRPYPFQYYNVVMPAGSVTGSAPDMARFMLAVLNGGKLGSARILKPESVRLLQSNSFANTRHLPGMAHGLMVVRDTSPRLLGHGGAVEGFKSSMILAPQARLGFYISVTGGTDSAKARTELSQALIGRLFPQTPAARWTATQTPPPIGSYRPNRRDFSKTPDPAQDLKVSIAGLHRVMTESDGLKVYWEQIGPRLYEKITGARDGGPFDQLEFHGTSQAPKLSFSSSPSSVYHLVGP